MPLVECMLLFLFGALFLLVVSTAEPTLLFLVPVSIVVASTSLVVLS